uniref:LIM zinc-binding domain-containing protein n=1 Tax=Hucho hucho TaxID=62062 RepID=A0A4W5KVS4_9TELE
MYGIQCDSCKKYITGKVLEAGEKHYHPSCARCARCEQMFGEGEEMYLQGNSIWHPPCRQAARQEEKSKKQVRIQLNDVPEQQVSRTSSESITSAPASSASGSPNRVIYAKLGDEMLDYKDLAALPKIKAIYNIDRPDMLSYSPYVSYPSEERHYGEGDGEKSSRQRRPSSPSSNSSLGRYGGYTPSRSPQNYSRPEDLYMAIKAMGNRYGQALDSSSLPHPSAYTGGPKYLSSLARDSSSLPMDYSRGLPPKFPGGLQVPWALTQPGKMSPGGRVSPGGRNCPLPLNPTTLAMLQQHSYVPYFRVSESGRSTPSLSTYSDGKSPSFTYVATPRHFHVPASRTSWQEGDDVKVRRLSVRPPVCPSVCLYIHLLVYLPTNPFIHPSTYRIYHYIHPSIYIIYHYIHPSIYRIYHYIHPSIYSIYHYIHPSIYRIYHYIHPSIYSIYHYIHPSIYRIYHYI